MTSQTYYVSGTGNDKNNGLKEGAAFRTLGRAVWGMKTGDTLMVMNGTYDKGFALYGFNGSPNNWTTIKAYPGHTPKIETTGGGISVFSSSYVRIEGLELEGDRKNITLEYAMSQKNNPDNTLTNANGIYVAVGKNSQGEGGTNPHHIVITGNTVRNFPGGGIAFSDSDYITVEKNTVSGNAWYSSYGNQGITALRSFNFDKNTTDYRIKFIDNVVYDNKSLVPWKDAGKITEGHGLMLDTTIQAQGGQSYSGKALIANNVAYNNGGSGINVFKAANVDVVNNTVYKNGRVLTKSGEINASYSENVDAQNNIIYASDNQNANLVNYAKNVTFENNLVYNSSLFKASDNPKAKVGQNILGKDPMFVDAANKNFQLKAGSAAIDAGSSLFNSVNINVPVDGDGNGTALIDIGAHEVGVLNGTNGNDKLQGGTGNDLLTGGQGNDVLVGGTGADHFVYNTKAVFTKAGVGVDTIADFNHSQGDKIVLDKTTFSAITSDVGTGFSHKSDFQVTSLGALSNAVIVYNSMTGQLIYNPNGSAAGFGTGGEFAQLTGKPTLTASDFMIQA